MIPKNLLEQSGCTCNNCHYLRKQTASANGHHSKNHCLFDDSERPTASCRSIQRFSTTLGKNKNL